jgi:hypothetical protein
MGPYVVVGDRGSEPSLLAASRKRALTTSMNGEAMDSWIKSLEVAGDLVSRALNVVRYEIREPTKTHLPELRRNPSAVLEKR